MRSAVVVGMEKTRRARKRIACVARLFDDGRLALELGCRVAHRNRTALVACAALRRRRALRCAVGVRRCRRRSVSIAAAHLNRCGLGALTES